MRTFIKIINEFNHEEIISQNLERKQQIPKNNNNNEVLIAC